jgi:hypothetical protein
MVSYFEVLTSTLEGPLLCHTSDVWNGYLVVSRG